MIDGRRVEVLQIDYGTEPGLISYNRVVEQRDGGVTGIEYSLIYEPLLAFVRAFGTLSAVQGLYREHRRNKSAFGFTFATSIRQVTYAQFELQAVARASAE